MSNKALNPLDLIYTLLLHRSSNRQDIDSPSPRGPALSIEFPPKILSLQSDVSIEIFNAPARNRHAGPVYRLLTRHGQRTTDGPLSPAETYPELFSSIPSDFFLDPLNMSTSERFHFATQFKIFFYGLVRQNPKTVDNGQGITGPTNDFLRIKMEVLIMRHRQY